MDHPGGYLRILSEDGSVCCGGNQTWWIDRLSSEEKAKAGNQFGTFFKEPYYRLYHYGCGVIAMNDLQLYLERKIREKEITDTEETAIGRSIKTGTGEMTKERYREILEQSFRGTYSLRGGLSDYLIGLKPWKMTRGVRAFYRKQGMLAPKTKWAPGWIRSLAVRKKMVAEMIPDMLSRDVPVVFAYYNGKGKRISLYRNLFDLKRGRAQTTVNSHYMTIVGFGEIPEEGTGRKVLEVISWGQIYYIDFEEYAESLSLFSNILWIAE